MRCRRRHPAVAARPVLARPGLVRPGLGPGPKRSRRRRRRRRRRRDLGGRTWGCALGDGRPKPRMSRRRGKARRMGVRGGGGGESGQLLDALCRPPRTRRRVVAGAQRGGNLAAGSVKARRSPKLLCHLSPARGRGTLALCDCRRMGCSWGQRKTSSHGSHTRGCLRPRPASPREALLVGSPDTANSTDSPAAVWPRTGAQAQGCEVKGRQAAATDGHGRSARARRVAGSGRGSNHR